MLKNKFLIYGNLFFITIMLQAFVSCSRLDSNHVDPVKHPDLVDQSWLSDQPCSVPCWQGLELETSSREEAIESVQNLSFIQKDNFTTYSNWVNFLCKEPSNITCVSMAFENETLTSLRLYVNYQLSLEQIVNEIGPPDSFFFSRRNPEGFACDITLFWVDRQMSVDIRYDGRKDICESFFIENGKFPQEMSVSTANYMVSSEMERFMEAVKVGRGYNFMLWSGFVE
ncbi:MAG: hypothetical protein ACT6FF_07230 [Methanosarcinaceae archaeon]